MRPIRLTLAALACLALLPSCTTPQFDALNADFTKSKQLTSMARAQYLAVTAMTTQMALAHVATALAGLVSKDFNGTPIGNLNSDIQTSYQIDQAAGTGQVTGVRDGKTVVDLHFTFDRDQSGGYTTYTVQEITGSLDGYQLVLPKMSITYAPQQDASGAPIKDASGNQAFFAMAEASGSLNSNGVPVIRLPSTVLSVLYPIPENASVGRIAATQDAMSFDGEVKVKNNTLTGTGTIKDAAGKALFDLNAVGTQIEVTPAL